MKGLTNNLDIVLFLTTAAGSLLLLHHEERRQRRRRHRLHCMRLPRFARHELDRLSVGQLKELLRQHQRGQVGTTTTRRGGSSIHNRFLEKYELVDHVIKSGAIDLVPSYKLSELNAMSIKQLKNVMSKEAGVYFDRSDVVEKSDVVNLFVNSGRVKIVPEDGTVKPKTRAAVNDRDGTMDRDDDTDRKPSAQTILVETVDESDGSEQDMVVDTRTNTNLVMEEDVGYAQRAAAARASTHGPLLPSSSHKATRLYASSSPSTTSSLVVPEQEKNNGNIVDSSAVCDADTATPGKTNSQQNTQQQPPSLASATNTNSDHSGNIVGDTLATTNAPAGYELPRATAAVAPPQTNAADSTNRLSHAERASVDVAGCLERSDFAERLGSSGARNGDDATGTVDSKAPAFANTTIGARGPADDHPLASWGESELAALAALARQ